MGIVHVRMQRLPAAIEQSTPHPFSKVRSDIVQGDIPQRKVHCRAGQDLVETVRICRLVIGDSLDRPRRICLEEDERVAQLGRQGTIDA